MATAGTSAQDVCTNITWNIYRYMGITVEWNVLPRCSRQYIRFDLLMTAQLSSESSAKVKDICMWLDKGLRFASGRGHSPAFSTLQASVMAWTVELVHG